MYRFYSVIFGPLAHAWSILTKATEHAAKTPLSVRSVLLNMKSGGQGNKCLSDVRLPSSLSASC